jgi:CMP-N-acetylneuraminic acid synthetase
LLPMKANSQRVAGKNFKYLHGKPLYQWILSSLLAVERVERVIINTDAEILLGDRALQENERVVLRERAGELRGDQVSMNKILADDIEFDSGERFLMTHSTNPFLSASTMNDAITRFEQGLAQAAVDSLFSVNCLQTRLYRADGSAVNHDPQLLIQTQDLEPWFEENSCLYLFTRDSFLRTSARIGKKPMMCETPKLESLDIDTPQDWSFAEAIAPLAVNFGIT